MNFNQIILGGVLVDNPTRTEWENGTFAARFYLSVRRDVKYKGKWVYDRFACIAWAETAENILTYLADGAGRNIFIVGKVSIDRWKASFYHKVVVQSWKFNDMLDTYIEEEEPEPEPEQQEELQEQPQTE